jgi:hypothetical protein
VTLSFIPSLNAQFGTLSVTLVSVTLSSQLFPIFFSFDVIVLVNFHEFFIAAHLVLALSLKVIALSFLKKSAVLSSDSQELDLRPRVVYDLVGRDGLSED